MTWQPRLTLAPDATIGEFFDMASEPDIYGDSGICRHLPYLKSLVGLDGDKIVELGCGGMDQSTVAWLAGLSSGYQCRGSLTCYDLLEYPALPTIRQFAKSYNIGFDFVQGSTATSEPRKSDILFIDTLHDADTVQIELRRFAPLCSRLIVFHDVVTFGRSGQFAGADRPNQGINLAIAEFLFLNPEWRVERFVAFDNGLLTLRKAD
jgi:hypothetical protein